MPILTSKRVRCPKCRREHTFKVSGDVNATQWLGESGTVWVFASCEGCGTGFEFTNDRTGTGTRLAQ